MVQLVFPAVSADGNSADVVMTSEPLSLAYSSRKTNDKHPKHSNPPQCRYALYLFPFTSQSEFIHVDKCFKKSSLTTELMAGSLPVFCQSPILLICTNLTNSATGSKVVLVRWNYTPQLNRLHASKFFFLPFACMHHNPLQPVTTKTTLVCSSGRHESEELDSVNCRYFFP